MKINCFTRRLGLLALGLIVGMATRAQLTYTFTSCGQTGSVGPTQAQVNNIYANTTLNNMVTASGGIQSFTVPYTGGYRLIARGAQGGFGGGAGAYMAGDFTLTAGAVLRIVVGQSGTYGVNNQGTDTAGGGGGGSYIIGAEPTNSIFVIAGGGGGRGNAYATALSYCTSLTASMNGIIVTSGNSEPNNRTSGGSSGAGGSAASTYGAAGGGGFSGDGTVGVHGTTPYCFLNGSVGGRGGAFQGSIPSNKPSGDGGFGGGGGGYNSGTGERGGGGGGYSGGAGGYSDGSQCSASGGGGGSYNGGAHQTNSVTAWGLGNGEVVIVQLCDVDISANTTNSLAPVICSGSPVTLTSRGVGSFSWNTGGSSQSIVVSPTVTTTYTLSATGALACSSQAAITVTVDHMQCASASLGVEAYGGKLEDQLTVYPNPSEGYFTIDVQTDVNIKVIGETGQLIKQTSLNLNSQQLDMTNLANGIYFIVAEKGGRTATRKVIVAK